MDNIKWEDGAVCFATNEQRYANDDAEYIVSNSDKTVNFNSSRAISSHDFQLNEIRQGDYIEASELDTEQKYNDAVDVFGLFGWSFPSNAVSDYERLEDGNAVLCAVDFKLYLNARDFGNRERKLTYPQLMAIGKLKRAMIERGKASPAKAYKDWHESQKEVNKLERDKSTVRGEPKSDFIEAIKRVDELESEWTDKHYNNFYKLTEEDIKAGQVKIDAYFVNRMWKINQWDDTGAGFHILKTLPRIANNKNSLNRELVALKKQISILCKLHGVDDDTN